MQNYSVKSIKWQGVQKSAMPLRLDYDQSTHKLCFSWSGYFSKLARTPSLISHTFFFNLMKMFPSDIGFYLSTCGLQTHKQQAGKISCEAANAETWTRPGLGEQTPRCREVPWGTSPCASFPSRRERGARSLAGTLLPAGRSARNPRISEPIIFKCKYKKVILIWI